MSHSRASLLATALATLAFTGCDAGDKSVKENAAPGPTLRITTPKMDQTFPEGADVQVMFDLRDYQVSKTAKGAEGAANPYLQGSGQHVHLILDNAPYEAVYDVSKGIPLKKELLTPGSHVIRAFPSAGANDAKGAPWHESRKNAGAFAWVRFHVKEPGNPAYQDFDADKRPTLTYSRPKGEYVLGNADAKLLFPLMVDFYVTGCTLSKDGFKVRATIDGKAAEYTEWKSQRAEGDVAAGDHTVVLDLIDKDGKPVDGPFNHTERKITVK